MLRVTKVLQIKKFLKTFHRRIFLQPSVLPIGVDGQQFFAVCDNDPI
jgi:hypothetical protein